MAEVPQKKLGKFYAVVLRDEGFSLGNVAMKGALGGNDAIPIPALGTQCVCCNEDPEGETFPIPMTDPGDKFSAPPLDAPVCGACQSHVAEATGASILAACGLCVGLPLAGLGFFSYENTAIGVVGLLIAAFSTWWVWRMHQHRMEHTRGGHHPGMSLLIAPKQCVVRTANRALAERVADLNAPKVFKIR